MALVIPAAAATIDSVGSVTSTEHGVLSGLKCL